MKASHRLRSSEEFRRITRRGVRSAQTHVVVHAAPLREPASQVHVGFVVSKKVGNSVIRHRVARRLRGLLIQSGGPELVSVLPPGTGVVVRCAPGINELTPVELRQELETAINKVALKLSARETSAEK